MLWDSKRTDEVLRICVSSPNKYNNPFRVEFCTPTVSQKNDVAINLISKRLEPSLLRKTTWLVGRKRTRSLQLNIILIFVGETSFTCVLLLCSNLKKMLVCQSLQDLILSHWNIYYWLTGKIRRLTGEVLSNHNLTATMADGLEDNGHHSLTRVDFWASPR